MKTVFFDTVFFDIDTQIDFLYPAGALYVPGAEAIVENIAALNRYAASQGYAVISTMDLHSEDDPEFKTWPPHCVLDTTGQRKPAATLLEKSMVVPNKRANLATHGVQQFLVEKQTFDCFTNVNLPHLLTELAADRYVVYGVVTEICVKMAAEGLLKTGKTVVLVTDAIRSLRDDAASEMKASFTAAGGLLTTVQELLQTAPRAHHPERASSLTA